MKLGVIHSLVILISLVFASPTPIGDVGTICANTCTVAHKFGYRPGRAYEFEYNVQTTTGVKGTSVRSSSLEITAAVVMEVVSKCDFILKIQNAQLYEMDLESNSRMVSSGSERFQRDMEQNELKFSFQDGIIDGVCSVPEEPIWVLNIKRGILSVLQNSMDNLGQQKTLKETDITGICDTDYTVIPSQQGGHMVRKTKDLQGCTDRQGFRTALHGVPYGDTADFQSLPLMSSTHQCQQEISSDGLLNAARCVENHLFRPFSREGSGAVTDVLQTLEFVQETIPVVTSQGILTNRQSLLFYHKHDGGARKTTFGDIEAVLREICETTQNDIRPESTTLFKQLNEMTGTLEEHVLKDVYHQLGDGQLCADNSRTKKFFLDALPLVGSISAVRLMTELILSADVTGPEADVLLTTLSFTPFPSKQMLKELTPLLTMSGGNALLPVSSLVQTYCRSSPCDDDTDIHDIMNAMKNHITQECYVDDDNIQMIMFSLRAIGNSGQANQTFEVINNCMTKAQNPVEVRLAAIDAYRQFSCSVQRSNLLQIFTNTTEDPELRITAYLAAMKCADVQIIDIVIRTMEVEQVNQVGSFVWSHLTNLNETSDRHKQGLRDLLATINIGDKFNLDKRKFSHHFEKSFFLQQYNIGSSFESNIVWSPSSFVPKSLSANLTVDLFGRSVNLLDIGGRFEGIEAFLESYFGPNGYFSDVGDYGISRHIEQSAQFQKLMDIRSKLPRATDPKGTFYARIFGQERGYARFDGQNSLFGDNFNILELLISMTNNQEYKKTQNVQFLDSSLIVPTCAGLPISLSVDGTVTIDLKASGRMDLRKLITSPRSVLIDGAIEPSASVEISGLMSLDASVTKSGIKVLSNVHTSTLLKGKIEYTEGRNVKLEVDIPRDKMEIVSFKTAIFHNANGRDYEQPTTESRQHSHRFCTGDMVEQLSGLQLCGEIEVPVPEHPTGAPYMSLTGPVQANVQLLKTDNMTGYKFESRFVKTKQAITVHIEVDTPGSDTDRRIGASFAMDNLDPSISLNIFSPWKKVLFNGVFENSRTLRRVFGKLSVDSSHDFSINAELLRSRRGHSIVYTPNLDIRLPLQERIRLEGTIVYLPFKTIDLDIMLNGVQTSPIMTKVTLHNKSMIRSILGSISFEPGKDYRASAGIHRLWSNRAVKYRPYMSIQTPQKEILVFDGSTEYKPGRTVTIGIRLRKAFKENISVFCRIRKIASKRNKRYETKLDVGSGYVNTRIHSSVVIRGKKAFLSRSSVDYVIPEVMREKITINGKGNIVQSKYLTVATSTLNVGFKKQTDYDTDISTELTHNARNTKFGVHVKYGADKQDTNSKMSWFTTVVHRLSWSNPTLSVNTSYRHHAQDVEVRFEAGHTHSSMSMESSVRYAMSRIQPIALTIRVKKAHIPRKSLLGTLLLSLRGQNVKLGNELVDSNNGTYTNKMTLEWEPGKRNTIMIVLRMKSAREAQYSTDIHFVDFRRIRFSGRHLIAINNISSFAELTLAGKKYAWLNSLQFEKDGTQFIADVKMPSRHFGLESHFIPQLPLNRLDINALWSNSKSATRHLHVLAIINVEHFGFSILKKSPFGEVDTDFNLHGDFRFRLNSKIQWGSLKGVVINGTFRNDGINGNSNIHGALNVASPFRGYRAISITTTHISDWERYLMNVNVQTKSGKKITASVTFSKPITFSFIVGTLGVKSTLKNFQVLQLECVHAIERGISSMAKFTWNRNAIQVYLKGYNRGTMFFRDIGGVFSVKSTFPGIDSVILDSKHIDDGRRFNNHLRLLRNGNGIKYKGDMLHDHQGWQIQNSGNISFAIFSKKFHSFWSHANTPSEVISKLNCNFGKRTLNVDFSMNHTLTLKTGTLNMISKIAGNVLPNMELFARHIHNSKGLDNTFGLRRTTKLLFSAINQLQINDESIDLSHTTQIMNKIYLLNTVAESRNYPYSGFVEFQWPNKEMIHASFLWNNVDGLYDGSASIRFPKLKDISLSLQQHSTSQELINTITALRNANRIILLESRHSWGDVKTVHIEVTTHFKIIRTLEAHMALSGNLRQFHTESNIAIQYRPSKRVEMAVAVGNIGKLEGTFLLKLPLKEDIRILYLQNGNPTNIHMEFQYHPRKRFEADLKIGLRNNRELVILVKTPFTKDMAGLVLHTMQSSGFVTHTELKYGFTKLLFADVNLGWKKNIIGNFALKSVYIENVDAGFYHKRTFGAFKTHWELQRRSKVILEGDIGYERDRNFTHVSTMSMLVPGFKRFNAALTHRGRLTRFNTNMNVKYGNIKVGILAVFTTSPNLDASIQIATPLKGLKTLHAAIHHEGTRKAFNSKASFGVGKSSIVGTSRFSLRPLRIEVNLQTPFARFRQRRIFYTHTGSFSQFQCQTEIVYSNTKRLSGDIQFNLKPLTGTVSLVTPFARYETFNMKLSHNAKRRHYQSFLDINLPRDRKLSLSANFDLSVKSTRSASITIISPFKKYDKIEAGISITGTVESFECRSLLGIGKRQIIGFARFGVLETIGGELALMTPFVGYRKLTFVFQYVGASINFKLRTGVMVLDSIYEMELTHSALLDYETSLVLRLPDTDDIKLSTLISKTRRKVMAQADLTLGRTDLANAKFKCALSPRIRGSGIFKSRWTKSAKLFLSHDGSRKNFHTAVRINYDKVILVLSTKLDTTKDISGSLNFRSPFAAIEQIDATVFHSARQSTYRYDFESRSHAAKVADVHMEANLLNRKDVFLDIRLPFDHMKHTVIIVNYSKENYNMNGRVHVTLNEDVIESNLTLNVLNGAVGQLQIQSPWYDDVTGVFRYYGHVSDFHLEADLNYNGIPQIQTVANISVGPQTRLVLTLDTPYVPLRHLDCKASHHFAPGQCSSEIDFVLNEHRLAGSIDLNVLDGIVSSGTLTTPFTEDISMTFSHNGTMTDLASHIKATYGNEQYISANIKYDPQSIVDVNVSLHTTFERLSDLQILLSHSLGNPGFHSSILVDHNTNRKIEFNIQFTNIGDQSDSIELESEELLLDFYFNEVPLMFTKLTFRNHPFEDGSLIVRTGFESIRSGNFSLKRKIRVQSLDISISGKTSNFQFIFLNNLTTNGLLRIHMPVSEQGNISILFSFRHDTNALITNMEVINKDYLISCYLEIDLQSTKHISFNVQTPLQAVRNIGGTVTYLNTDEELSNHIALRLSPSYVFESSIHYFSMNKFNLSLVVQSPYVGYEYMSVSFGHALNRDNIITYATLSREREQENKLEAIGNFGNDLRGHLNIVTQLYGHSEICAAFRKDIQINLVTFDATFELDRRMSLASVSLSPASANVTLHTPYVRYEHISFAVSHNITAENALLLLEVSTGPDHRYGLMLDVGFSSGVINIHSPIPGYEELSAVYGHDIHRDRVSSHIVITYATGKTIDIAFKCSVREGSLVVHTPIIGYENVSMSFLNINTNTLFVNRVYTSLYKGKSMGYYIEFNRTISDGFEVNVITEALLPRLKTLKGSAGLYLTRGLVSFANITASFDSDLHELGISVRNDIQSETKLHGSPIPIERKPTIILYITAKSNNQTHLDVSVSKRNECPLTLKMQKPYFMQFYTCAQTPTESYNQSDVGTYSENSVYGGHRSDVGSGGRSSDVGSGYHRQINNKMHSSRTIVLSIEEKTLFRIQHTTDKGHHLHGEALREQFTVQIGSTFVRVNQTYGREGGVILRTSLEMISSQEVIFKTQSSILSQQRSATINVALTLPRIEKAYGIYSSVTLNSGNIIFDGEIGLGNPEDVHNHAIIYSRVRNDYANMGHNLSFVVGMMGTMSTVDIQLSSYFGYINDVYYTGTQLLYLTEDKDRKDITLKGTVNSAVTEATLEIVSPMASIQYSGQVHVDGPYGMSIHNIVNETPTVLELHFDPFQPRIEGRLEMTSKVIYLEVFFVNGSCLRASVFRGNSTERVNDVLITSNLLSPRIITTNVNWRPAAFQDVMYTGLQLPPYMDISTALRSVGTTISSDINAKYNNLRSHIFGDIAHTLILSAAQILEMADNAEALQYRIRQRKLTSLDTLLTGMTKHLKTVMTKADHLSVWLKNSANEHVSYPIKDALEEYLLSSSTVIENLEDEIRQKLNSQAHVLIERLREEYVSLLQHLDYMRDTSAAMTDLIEYRYNYFLSEWPYVISGFDVISSLIRSKARMRIETLGRAVGDIQLTRVVQFDPNSGELEAKVYLPFGVKSLKSPLPNVNLTNYIYSLTTGLEYMMETAYKFYDILNSDISLWIPPFSASASISRDVVKTFDGTAYPIEGRCTYLLAGDVRDGNFSVVMGILGKQKVKVVVTTRQHTVQLSPRKQVRIDGALVILPYRIHDIYVSKVRGTIIITGSGFSLNHNIRTETYSLSVSGWYLGKTVGLLGTYDNEPHNDMMLSTGEISSNITTFRQSWDINNQCI